MEGRYREANVLVTGAASGMGRAIVIKFASEGAFVGCLDRDAAGLKRTVEMAETQGGRAVSMVVDVVQADQVDAAVSEIRAIGGSLDVAVNCAGISFHAPFLEITPVEWDGILSVNLKSQFLVGQRVAKEMVKVGRGVILNITSIGAFAVSVTRAPYSASKAGARSLTETMALELAPYGIRVNAIAPGPIRTPMTAGLDDASVSGASTISVPPLNRWGTPEEVAAAACFLASDDASFITGASLVIDGGYSLAH